MSTAAGLRSLATALPGTIRTNDYWQERYPEIVATAHRRALSKLWAAPEGEVAQNAFDIELAPYLSDPFRGAVRRRVAAPDETALSLEIRAARAALAGARLSQKEVELTLSCSFLPDQLAVGNGLYLAKAMELRCPSWNIESACTGSLAALETARALIRTGEYRNVLVTASTLYSRITDDADTLSWSVGDGAVAFVVGAVPEGEGVLSVKSIHTGETCNMFVVQAFNGPDRPVLRGFMPDPQRSSRMARDTGEPYVRACVDGALAAAGVRLEEIRFLVCNTPNAWYAAFVARVLGLDSRRSISMFPEYGNIGAASVGVNLYHAAAAGRVRRGDLVLLYSVGSTSSASAVVVRWGDVALAPGPGLDGGAS